jgi:hypothetical protein
MVVFIEILNDSKLIKLENVDHNSKIYVIKNKIKEQEYIPIDEQIIYYNNIILEDNKSLSNYTTDLSSNYNLLILEKPFQIILKTMFNKEFIIKNITSQILIEEIFLILFYYYDIYPDDITLVHQNKKLDKSKKIAYYNIRENSSINIIIKTKTGFF